MPSDSPRIRLLYQAPFGDYRGDILRGRYVECGIVSIDALGRCPDAAAEADLISRALLDENLIAALNA